MDLFDLLPMPPWEGPPFPRFMGVRWPWVQQSEKSSEERQFFLPPLPKLPGPLSMGSTYDNEETWEWEDYKGRQRKITVHRHAQER